MINWADDKSRGRMEVQHIKSLGNTPNHQELLLGKDEKDEKESIHSRFRNRLNDDSATDTRCFSFRLCGED